ncbi:hypothetical protein F5879DRAFT_364495 [Lentinula edodes]|uniref:uncharacterized protein n=1 Tax=Lentinula edodes TaxID=5353 RepID=UPI001E8EBAFC|nr:uncharacterized protein C8R40DRAFT_613570 [Lentinula edodes]KAH7870883.1 hypothetical protein C8R40DRAFT_613570 [Lentinula edodes]KAJ3901017.1 hypothetical protein F5879DRAFT_364495 [Lentinula edodes]
MRVMVQRAIPSTSRTSFVVPAMPFNSSLVLLLLFFGWYNGPSRSQPPRCFHLIPIQGSKLNRELMWILALRIHICSEEFITKDWQLYACAKCGFENFDRTDLQTSEPCNRVCYNTYLKRIRINWQRRISLMCHKFIIPSRSGNLAWS